MLEEEYQLDYFKANGLERKICTSCGAAFWTRDPERKICGDAPCATYDFIGNPVFTPHTLDEMREAYLSFFEQHGHTRVGRFPVAARWRDDIYLTIASIADFQPFVTSGVVPPPANPLTISQSCIRLNDLASVGMSGRHLTTFEMMAHHAFNSDTEEIYWKDKTVELCDQFLESIGGDLNDVTYKEHPWIGGGNAGPSLEIMIGGLEVATLVFMSLGKTPNEKPPIELEGTNYYPIDLRIVDTGYGLERLVWASKGSPTIYDAIFPEMVSRLMESVGIGHLLESDEFTRILALNAKYSGMMDISGSNLAKMRKKIAKQIGVDYTKLQAMMAPIERIYAIVDHTRCLAFMLGDCIVPSNAQEGYLARLVLRRTLRMMQEIELKESLFDLIKMQMETIGLESFEQQIDIVQKIVANEIVKYEQTMERGARIVQKLAKDYKKKGESIPTGELIKLYDSHGIPPEIVKDIADDFGATVDLPDDFYSMIADVHSESEAEAVEDPYTAIRDRLSKLPPTKMVYYDQTDDMEFEAMVIDQMNGYVVLDQTLFYPEGGGQPADVGKILSEEGVVDVTHTFKLGNVIIHEVDGPTLKRGELVKGLINEKHRRILMRHHTATHVLLHAAREVLGKHIHQAGAQKGEESSRLDLRHYTHITPEEMRRIEVRANELVLADLPVYTSFMDRTSAEQKYGFDLYQGGVPPGSEIRIVRVGGDVQACAGTHCQSTCEIGSIKLIRIEHVQDGIERIEFAAGMPAVNYTRIVENLLDDASVTLSVQRENLPGAVQRFFTEWKDQKKEIERLTEALAELRMDTLTPTDVNGVPVLVENIDGTPKDLVSVATGIANDGGVALIIGGSPRVHVVVASGTDAVNAGEIVRDVCALLGGKGGGKPGLAQGSGSDPCAVSEALAQGKARIEELLQ